jgi:hypothetical protein
MRTDARANTRNASTNARNAATREKEAQIKEKEFSLNKDWKKHESVLEGANLAVDVAKLVIPWKGLLGG